MFGLFNKSQIMILQGLTHLRQMANHPSMVQEDYSGDSGKLENVLLMLENALLKEHKVLIFSQFVKHLQLVKKELDQKEVL